MFQEMSVDTFFAKSLLPEGSEAAHCFLKYLFACSREGHLCIHIQDGKIFPEPPQEMRDQVLQGKDEVFHEAIIHKENRWYLKRNWEIEETFLLHVKRVKEGIPLLPLPFSREGLSEEQIAACQLVSEKTLSLIQGGPGTGKTTLIANLLTDFSGTIALVAPTGKATANLRKKHLPGTIKTLHALLQEPFFLYDLLVIDEASMVDASLFAKFFSKVKTGARVILLGDRDQLPPVEQGNFFNDLLDHAVGHIAHLTHCFRAELREVLNLAEHVRKGETLSIEPLPAPDEIVPFLAKKMGRAKILSPLRQGPYGVDTLNHKFYELFRGSGEIPLIVNVNDSQLDIYNGDMGILRGQHVYFEEGRVIPEALLQGYEWAYLISVHKSQGSEYEEVIVLLPEGSEQFGREMLYTAVTRAKRRVTVLGKQETYDALRQKRSVRLSCLTRTLDKENR